MKSNAIQKHDVEMIALNKRFKLITLRTILIWLAVNLVVDVVTYLIFASAHIEIFIFALFACFVASTWVMINSLNKWRAIKEQQIEQLLEKAPIGRLRF